MAISDVYDYWHTAPRRERRQTAFTATLVLLTALLVVASFLV